jgi:hypothetical protein
MYENIIDQVQAVLVNARFDNTKSCHLADAFVPLPTNKSLIDSANTTLLFVYWPDAIEAGCYTFNQVGY